MCVFLKLETEDSRLPLTLASITDPALVIKEVFERRCRFHWREYFISEEAEVQKDMRWARSRKSVCKRHAAGTDKFNDPPSSAAACLSESERTRLATYAQLFLGQMGDLGRSPDKRPLVTRSGKLHTIIRNNHLMFDPLMGRWMTPEEVFCSQGWPINAAAIAAAKTSSHFSKCHPVPQGRTRRSALNQVGNAMHINVMGSVML